MKRCRWCGRFVTAAAEPILGADGSGTPVAQMLCPEDGEHWRDLTRQNMNRIEERHELGWL